MWATSLALGWQAFGSSPEAPSYAEDSVFRPDPDRNEELLPPPNAAQVTASIQAAHGSPFSYFGHAVALDGDTAVVGTPYEDTQLIDTGVAYVFRLSQGRWRQAARLTAPQPQAYDRFGWSVALSGQTIVVGADRSDRAGLPDSGEVYVFETEAASGGWRLKASLGPQEAQAQEALGSSVALQGDTLLVGAPGSSGPVLAAGAAYVFRRHKGRWTQEARLTAPTPSPYSAFGHAVALSGGTALVGASAMNLGGMTLAGAAYVFQHQGGAWRLEAALSGADSGPLEKFGAAVALQGDLAAVSAPRAPFGEKTRAGAVYLFQRRGESWKQAARLTAALPRSDEEFGRTVALSRQHLLVASQFGDFAGLNTGVGYLFTPRADAWVLERVLIASQPSPMDEFGTAIALSERHAILGAPRRGDDSNARGCAYIHDFVGRKAGKQKP